MNKSNFFSNLITLGTTIIALFITLLVCNNYYQGNMMEAILRFFVGAVVAGILNTFVHELGHLIAGKKNNFVFSSMVVWFFKWKKHGKNVKFSLVFMGEEAGYTEMIPTNADNVCEGYTKMTKGGIFASFFFMILGIPPLFMPFLPVWIFSIWSMFLTIGIYYFLGVILPISTNGILNDGAVLYNVKHETDTAKVIINLLKIQANLYAGKTPSEIDESLYFNLPQLPEDDINFALLLHARYMYYLDKKDYENAQKTMDRILSLEEYLPKSYMMIFKTDALFNYCTFDFNEQLADDIMYEVESYINKINSPTNIRVKLSYLINIRRERDGVDIFFNKGYKEADESQIKGLGKYEKKLLDLLKEKLD